MVVIQTHSLLYMQVEKSNLSLSKETFELLLQHVQGQNG